MLELGQGRIPCLYPLLDGNQGRAQYLLGLQGRLQAIIQRQVLHVSGSDAGHQISLHVFPFIDRSLQLVVGRLHERLLLSPDIQAPVRSDAGLECPLRAVVAGAAGRRTPDRDPARSLVCHHQGRRDGRQVPRAGLIGARLGLDDAIQGDAHVRIIGEPAVDEAFEFTVAEGMPPLDGGIACSQTRGAWRGHRSLSIRVLVLRRQRHLGHEVGPRCAAPCQKQQK